MHLQPAQRKNVKIKLALQGASGSGKSYSALLTAFGLSNDWSKIAVIDTENQSASLYSHLGNFHVIDFKPPFSPERYIQAIEVCLKAQIQVIIIDSLSLEWEYILDAHGQLAGNSYTNWSKFTPRHQQLIQYILQADSHIIATLRAKQDYVLNEKNGKYVPEKIGMKPIQRDGVDYEFTIVLELDIKHNATASKDRTGLFTESTPFRITPQTGMQILEWCNAGIPDPTIPDTATCDLKDYINQCENIEELRHLYYSVTPTQQQQYRTFFDQRKEQLSAPSPVYSHSFNQTPKNSNGTPTHHDNTAY